MGLPQDWGSGCDGRWRVLVVGGSEALPEAGTERAVVDGAAGPEQPVGAAPGPAHLLRLGHPPVHQEVGRALGQGRAEPPNRPVSLRIVDQPVALAGEVVVQRPQGGPQLARRCDGAPAVRLAPEVVHDGADAIEADPGVPGLAVPQSPAQALDLLGDRRLRRGAFRTVGRQAAGDGTVKLSSKGTGKRRGSLEPKTYAAALAPVISAQIAKACARTARYSAAGR